MNDDQIQPTLHGEAPSGVCGRRTGDTVCGALATAHVVWRYDEGGDAETDGWLTRRWRWAVYAACTVMISSPLWWWTLPGM